MGNLYPYAKYTRVEKKERHSEKPGPYYQEMIESVRRRYKRILPIEREIFLKDMASKNNMTPDQMASLLTDP